MITFPRWGGKVDIKANSAQLSWSFAELGNILELLDM